VKGSTFQEENTDIHGYLDEWHTHSSISLKVGPSFAKPPPLTGGLADDEVGALVHLELPGVQGTVLLTQTLHLLALHAGESRHTEHAATQHRAPMVLHHQVGVPEQTGDAHCIHTPIATTSPIGCNACRCILSWKYIEIQFLQKYPPPPPPVHVPVLGAFPARFDPGGQQYGLAQTGSHQVLLTAHLARHQVSDGHVEVPVDTPTHQLHQLHHLILDTQTHGHTHTLISA